MLKPKSAFLTLAILVCTNSFLFPENVALTGGTIIDVLNFGDSKRNITNALVLIDRLEIACAGETRPYDKTDDDRVVDVSGKYIIPGIIDGFGALDNQSFASSYLYMGVTSIIRVYGGRRSHVLFERGAPGPTVIKWKSVGDIDDKKPDISSYLAEIERMAASGIRVVLLMYALRPDELKACVIKAHSLGMGTMGELGHTSYRDAVEAGIDPDATRLERCRVFPCIRNCSG